jgi:hypothetical protein
MIPRQIRLQLPPAITSRVRVQIYVSRGVSTSRPVDAGEFSG